MFNSKTRAEAVSIASNSLLILLKIVAGTITGSVALIAEAIHSVMDLASAIVAFISVSVSDKPADREHPFGHGKAENISGVVEAILIFVAAIIIVYEAVLRIISGETLKTVDVGIWVLAAAIVVNILVSTYLMKVSRKTDSLAVEADARHLSTDVITMVGVLLGLSLVRITGLEIFDRVAAILVSLIIVKTAYDLFKKSFGGLMDTQLPRGELNKLVAYINHHSNRLVSFHDIRTRKAGSYRFIDLHLVMPQHASVQEAHQVCDHLEEGIKKRFPNSSVTIHIEPCSQECFGCHVATCNAHNASQNTGSGSIP